MNISIATDFRTSQGSAKPYLKEIAEAGFTHIHWCHQWNTDYLYDDAEIAEIKKWFKEYGLTLLDIHGSQGVEKLWYSSEEYKRKAGVALVANRMKMLRAIDGTGAVMMHVPYIGNGLTPVEKEPEQWHFANNLKRSISELSSLSRELNVPLALENFRGDTFAILDEMFRVFPPEVVGLCFDSGHGNTDDCKGLDNLERNKERLIALHIHDNDGTEDLHQPPFMGTLDWGRFANILARSNYSNPISFEIGMMYSGFNDEKAFLTETYKRCAKFVNMVDAERAKL